MKYSMKLVPALAALSGLAHAQQLNKPALTSNLDYLLPGNAANLPAQSYKLAIWQKGWIPADCKSIAERENLAPSQFDVFQVTYGDCGDAWVFCRHPTAASSIQSVAATFGKLPVAIRDWVRHVLILPGANSAFNTNGNIAFFGTTGENIDVNIHESAHSLDGFAAFGEVLNTSPTFLAAYNADTHVPDNYARSSQAENVAQNTVVAVYDRNVPGGFPGVQRNWPGIANQYETILDFAGDALLPGGTCDRHLPNSGIVSTAGVAALDLNTTSSRVLLREELGEKPESGFQGSYGDIVEEFEPFFFRTDYSS